MNHHLRKKYSMKTKKDYITKLKYRFPRIFYDDQALFIDMEHFISDVVDGLVDSVPDKNRWSVNILANKAWKDKMKGRP